MAGKMKCCRYRLRDPIVRQKSFMPRAVGTYKKAGETEKIRQRND